MVEAGSSARWKFRSVVAVGFLLALTSLVVAVATYRFVAGHLALDHLNREAGRYAAVLEYRAQEEAVRSSAELVALLEEYQKQQARQIAWLRVVRRDGEMLAEAGEVPRAVFAEQELRDVLEFRRRNVVRSLETPRGEILAAVLPFRFQLESEIEARQPQPARGRQRRFKLIEVGLYHHGAADAFAPLKRNLMAGIAAALGLILALVFVATRFPAYMRGRELENQLALARRVQEELLPKDLSEAGDLEVASEFRPFWGVGGDYFDIFSVDQSRTFVVLGDVSGKGLPAALIMGLLHGAVRSAARAWDGSNHDQLAVQMNQLLHSNTGPNRFVTFFWACVDSREARLRYINAGHNPPLLVRRPAGAAPRIEELPAGGPVLGLLPGAKYRKGEAQFAAGDLLVVFSDGVVEAANATGLEFGQERIEEALREHAGLPPAELKQEILSRLRAFLGSAPLQDDLTLLIVRAPTPPRSPGGARSDAGPASDCGQQSGTC